jgi:3-methyladenine DNA glycosylase/8-oxoguanine DNA glycosylase
MPSKAYDSDGAHLAALRHEGSGSVEDGETSDKPAVGRSRSGQYEFTAKPTISDCQQVCSLLAEVHGGMPVRPARLAGATEEAEGVESPASRTNIATECGEVGEVLDGLVRTILSQHTSRANSSRAKHALDQHFGTGNYHALRRASVSSITNILQIARVGLAAQKSATIHALLNHIHLNLNPDMSLEFLRYLPDSEAMETLSCVDM